MSDSQPGSSRASVKSSASSSAAAAQRVRPGTRTHRGLTCQNCRIRKTRCDGTQPQCKTCEVYQDDCRYEKPPPMSQIIGMAKRLQEAESTIVELKRALEEQLVVDAKSSVIGAVPQTPAVAVTYSLGAPSQGTHPLGAKGVASLEVTTEQLLSDLSIDASGKICYYGTTSAVHDHAAFVGRTPKFQSFDEQNSKTDVRTLLTSNAMESRTWEEFAIGNAAVQNDMPRDLMSRLLKIHWGWISPMFMWVYRPAFMRDMMTGGQYYSPLLLNVMCGHAARFNERRVAEMLIARARLLLGSEIHKPSSVTTVQALLQLSARDLAYGQISQAWTYSGIAFRMVSDLGLRHSSGSIFSLASLNAEDLEIRRRTFWSCYFWDKAMSLYLGRSPALIELPSTHYPELLDDFAEHDLWTPNDSGPPASDKSSNAGFPPMKSHVVSCFVNSCKLAIIISDIIIHLYSSHHVEDVSVTLRAIRERLDEWRALSPDHLKLETDNLPNICPPPHIVSQNLLYFATIILLHRPFSSLPAHHTACRQAADSAEKLVLLIEPTYGFVKLSYLSAYCIYTSATVMVQDAKAGDAFASRKTETFLRALNTAAKTCHLIQRSVDIITNSLNTEEIPRRHMPVANTNNKSNDLAAEDGSGGGDDGGGGPLLNRQYLPAFLYRDTQIGYQNGPTVDGNMELDATSLLNCYPEQHMENSTGNWYLPP